MKTIHYFFDFLSPFSYFSWINSEKLRSDKSKECQFVYYPLLMAKLFAHHQQRGPGEIAPKRDFLFKQCLRYADSCKIPFEVPHHLPFNPMLALRIATKECSGDFQEQVISTLWRAIWQEKIDPESPDELMEALNKAGLAGSSLIEAAFSGPVKNSLRTNIESGIKRNLFGVPSFYVENELFWGNDSIPQLEKFLEGQDLFDLKKWNEYWQKIN